MDAAIVRGLDTDLVASLKAGAYLMALGGPDLAVQFRLSGLQIQDSFALFLPGPKASSAFLLRKPLAEQGLLEGIMADGVGCLNIDGCRVPGKAQVPWGRIRSYRVFDNQALDSEADTEAPPANPLGRWPVNVLFIHDKSCKNLGVIDDIQTWECTTRCPVRHLEDSRFFWQFESIGGMVEWMRKLITPPERECFISV